MTMIYTTIKIIILYLLPIALWGVEKFHSILFDYGWWKPVAFFYSAILIMTLALKINNRVLKKYISCIAFVLWLICIGLIIVYFMGCVDTFLGARPLNRLSYDDKFNIGLVIGVYIILKFVAVLFNSNKSINI